MKKLTAITIFLALSSVSISSFAKTKLKHKIDYRNLNYHQVQTVYNTLLRFYKTVEKNSKLEKDKTVFLKVFNEIIKDAYASDGASCFFGGWPSELTSSGICKHPKTHGISNWAGEKTSYQECPGVSTFRCSPLLFGPGADGSGICLETNGSFEGLTGRCESHPEYDKEKVYQKLLDKPELLERLVQATGVNGSSGGFCNQPVAKERADHVATCNALGLVLDETGAKFARQNEFEVQNFVEDNRKVNKAIGILDACEREYKGQEKLLGSNRQILSVVANSSFCKGKDLFQSVSGDELNQIKKDFEGIEDQIAPVDMLSKTTENELELSIKNLYFSMYQFSPNLDRTEYRRKIFDRDKRPELFKEPFFSQAIEYFKEIDEGIDKKIQNGKDPKIDLKGAIREPAVATENGKVIDPKKTKSFLNYQQEFNGLCNQIKADYENLDQCNGNGSAPDFCKQVLGNDYKTKEFDKGLVMNSDDEERFYQSQQAKLNSKMIEMKTNHPLGRIMSTPTFHSKVFPFSSNLAEKCAEGDIDNAMKIPSDNDIDESLNDYEELLLSDLDGVNENIGVSLKKPERPEEALEQIRDMLKYKPYLLGSFMKGKSPEEQILYSKYICKTSLDIYNSDENWRIAELSAGGIGLVATGILTASGFGAPVAPFVAKASVGLLAAGMIAEGGMAVQNYTDATDIDGGAAAGFTLSQLSVDEYGSQKTQADEQMRDAKLSAALVLLEPVAVVAKPTFKMAQTAYRARKSGLVDEIPFGAKDITPRADALPRPNVAPPLLLESKGMALLPSPKEIQAIEDMSPKRLGFLDQSTRKARREKLPELSPGDEIVTYTSETGKSYKRVITAQAKKNSKLDDVARRKALQAQFKSKLSHNNGKRRRQIESVIKAHNKVPCVIGQCSVAQLKQKMKIMRAQGIDKDVIHELLQKGFAGHSKESISALNSAKKAVFESVEAPLSEVTKSSRLTLDAGDPNAQWVKSLQDIGQADERVIVTVQKTMPDGTVKEASAFGRYNGTDGKQLILDNVQDGRFAINPKDPNVKVTNISLDRGTYKDSVYTNINEAVFETNPTRAIERLEGKSVVVKYTDEDGDAFDMAGEVVMKDGSPHIKYENKYNKGQFYYTDTKKLGDISEIQRVNPKGTWDAKANHPRDIEETFPQGTGVSVNYRKPSSQYGSTETTDEVLNGEYIGIVSDKVQGVNVQQLVLRKPDGGLQYIDIKNVDGLSSAGDSVIEFNGGLLPR